MAVAIWLGLIVLFVVFAAIDLTISHEHAIFQNAYIVRVVGCLLAVVALLALPLVVEFNVPPYNWNGGVQIAPEGIRLAMLDGNGKVLDADVSIAWDDGNCVNYGVTLAPVGTTIKPITENPKVREIKYRVTFKEVDAKKLVEAIVAMAPFSGPMKHEQFHERYWQLVRFYLYDFNDAHSKELAGFFNPLRPEQQAAFLDLLKKYLDPKLADVGLAVEAVTWDVL